MLNCLLDSAAIAISTEINDRRKNHDHRSGGYICKIRNNQAEDSGKHRKQNRKKVILPQILRNIPAGSCRQDQQRIDQQNPHPFDRYRNDHCRKYCKQVFHQPDRNPPAFRQCPMNADCMQTVKTAYPKYECHCENNRQIQNLMIGNT